MLCCFKKSNMFFPGMAPAFSLASTERKPCRVVNVYDGDTITVVGKLCDNDTFYKYQVRLEGIDTPEIREKQPLAKEARDELVSILTGSRQETPKAYLQDNPCIVWIKCGDFDKYGRLLGTIYVNKEDIMSVQDMLITRGFAVKYNGGTKCV